MLLTDLPEEILIMIFRELDFCSLQSLYDTCKITRNMVRMLKVIKKCDLSCSVMATVKSLKQPFFKEIAQNLLELNMCGVPDLCKTLFTSAVKRFKNLKVLDVSYTNINIVDLIEIHKVCPTLKDITINFQFGKITTLSNNILQQCQSVFENFENVHFIGSIYNLLHSKLGLNLLVKSNLNNLTYTLAERTRRINPKYEESVFSVRLPHFNQYIIYYLDWRYERNDLSPVYNFILAMLYLELENYEYLIIVLEKFEPKVYASPILKDFLQEKFNMESCIPLHAIKHLENMVFMWWNKETVNFDSYFYHRLAKHLEQYFPYYFNLHSELPVTPVPPNCKWFYTYAIPNASDTHRYILRGITKRRVGAPNFVLDYDVIFQNKLTLELSLIFKDPLINTITLPGDCSYLKKLTYLSLQGLSRFESDFFKILFKSCDNLVTLTVESIPVSPCASAIARSLPLSRTLKNIRLLEKNINFKKLFLSFSQCQTLENIHIVDSSVYENNDMPDPSIILEKCFRLYSIYLEVIVTKIAYAKIMRQFKKAKDQFNRPYLNITLTIPPVNKFPYNYDPFVKVFKLNPMKPV